MRSFPLHLIPRVDEILHELLADGRDKVFRWNHRTNVQKHLENASEAANIERNGRMLHTLRKTAGFIMEREYKWNQEIICRLLGHNLAVRLRNYHVELTAEEVLKLVG